MLTATGEKVEPQSCSNGIEATGSVIFIEENVAYKDNIKINITGGTLTSTKNNPIIVELNPTIGTEKELSSEVTGMYSVKNTTENSAVFYYTAK